MGRSWGKELEMVRPEGCSEDDFAEFCSENESNLKLIE